MIVISPLSSAPTSESLYPYMGWEFSLEFSLSPHFYLLVSLVYLGTAYYPLRRGKSLPRFFFFLLQLEFLTSNKLSICDLVFCILLSPRCWTVGPVLSWISVKAAEPWPKWVLNFPWMLCMRKTLVLIRTGPGVLLEFVCKWDTHLLLELGICE